MAEWSKDPSSSNDTLTSELIASERFARVWDYFNKWQPPPNMLVLAGQVLDNQRKRYGARASFDNAGVVMAALRRCAANTITKKRSSRDWLLDQINLSMPVSLHLVNDLYDYLASPRHGVVRKMHRNDIRTRVIKQAEEVFGKNRDALIEILDPKHPGSVRQLVRPNNSDDPASIITEPSDWQWLGPILLDMATHAPEKIIPEIVYLVADFGHTSTREIQTQWNQNLLEGIFKDNLKRLMEVLSTDFEMESVPADENAPAKVQKARELARQWLIKENPE